tara:strand:- start:2366 stop:2578 length:213 start_codon:yes stop_codon:yes gene_type:complete
MYLTSHSERLKTSSYWPEVNPDILLGTLLFVIVAGAAMWISHTVGPPPLHFSLAVANIMLANLLFGGQFV